MIYALIAIVVGLAALIWRLAYVSHGKTQALAEIKAEIDFLDRILGAETKEEIEELREILEKRKRVE